MSNCAATPGALPSLIATPCFLDSLIALFPSNSGLLNPWFYIASIIFTANDRLVDALAVFDYALEKFPAARHPELARIYKEALFKTNVLYGVPRFINLQVQWASEHPLLAEDRPYRNHSFTTPELSQRGRDYFTDVYGSSSNATLATLDKTHPDFLYYALTLIYGAVYAYDEVVGRIETSFSLIAALVGIGAATQINWHMEGALRRGATRGEVKAVREMCIKVIKELGKEIDSIPGVPGNVPERDMKRQWTEDEVEGLASRL